MGSDGWTVHELRDLWYVVRVKGWREDDAVHHVIDFEVFRILCFDGIGTDGTPMFERPDIVCPMDDPTTSLDEAAPCISGGVKWDGCSNVNFHTDKCMAHFCGKDSAMNVGLVLGKVYDFAKELMPTTWSKECWGEPGS